MWPGQTRSLPTDPTSLFSQTGDGGLNQTHEPRNMTWQVQQEKRGGGESWCELIELHLAKNTMCRAERGETEWLCLIATVYTDEECWYECTIMHKYQSHSAYLYESCVLAGVS